MGWNSPDGPDDEYRTVGKQEKPICTTRPSPSSDGADGLRVRMYLSDRGLDPDAAKQNGWYPSRTASDEELRVVIPCLSADLTNRYWQARLLYDPEGKYPPRYQSPRGVQRVDALAVVYPWSGTTIRGTVLVEGPMDALAAAGCGYVGIGWMGKDPGQAPVDFARTLINPKLPRYVVCDRDAVTAGIRIWSQFVGAYLVNPTPFKDLAEIPPEERGELFLD